MSNEGEGAEEGRCGKALGGGITVLSLNSSGTGHQVRGEVAFRAAQMGNGKEHGSRVQKDPG